MHPTTQNQRRTSNKASTPFTRSGTYPGLLATRYGATKRIPDTPLPWHNELTGDIGARVELFLQDPYGVRRLVSEDEDTFQKSFGSEYSDSETVKSVYDLGFSDRAANNEKDTPSYGNLNPDQLCRLLNVQQDPSRPFNLEHLVSQKIGKSLICYKTTEKFRYLPLDAFDKIFTPQIIYSLLKEKFPHLSRKQLAHKVDEVIGNTQRESTLSPRKKNGLSQKNVEADFNAENPKKSRRRIFALLVFIKALHHFDHFDRNGIYDYDFPLQDNQPDSEGPIDQRNFLEGWDVSDMVYLFTFQYYFWVPFFLIKAGELRSYPFDSKTVLPWEHIRREAHGGNGTIHKIQIHCAHFSLEDYQTSDGPQYFALKEIDNVDREVYRQEFKALEKTCARTYKDKHLIKLLLAFQRGDKYYLMFEWADGNLEQLWSQMSGDRFETIWVVEQCLGIAKAIRRIHGLSSFQVAARNNSSGATEEEKEWGRHGDIKPQNILWFKSYGEDNDLLVLSDLGLTRFHSMFTKSNIPHYRIDGFTGAYRPPEMDTGHPISSKYDIWSLGCVYLEFFCWYLEGYDSVMDFSIERSDEDDSTLLNVQEDKYFQKKFDENDRSYAVIKPAISKCIERLRNLDSCPEVIKEILGIIESSMLVVDLDKRESISQICVLLTQILKDTRVANKANTEPVFKGALAQSVGGVLTDGIVDRPSTLDIGDEQDTLPTTSPDSRKATLTRTESEPTYASVVAYGFQNDPIINSSNNHKKWGLNKETPSTNMIGELVINAPKVSNRPAKQAKGSRPPKV